MHARRAVLVLLPTLALGSAVGIWTMRALRAPRTLAAASASAAKPPAAPASSAEGDDDEDRSPFALRVPSGEPSSLSCEAARSVVAQVRGNLAYEPEPVSAHALAAATADWLDPHGLWSAAPDSPVAAVIDREGAALLRDLEAETGGRCTTALSIGRALVPWMAELAKLFDRARRAGAADASSEAADDVELAAQDSPFEDDTPARSARDLAALLGRRAGTLERAVGPTLKPFADSARAHFFPGIGAEAWQKVVLAAAVRAYVQIIDPHGAWAPTDEEASVYEMDLESPAPERLWEKASRTAIGARVESDPVDPLRVGDVILSIAGVSTAGLPLEQVEQMGYAAAEQEGPVPAVVLRRGERVLRELRIGAVTGDAREAPAPRAELPAERVPYGSGDALIVTVHDVRDDLGVELASAIADERDHDTRPVEGLVIDLRGNGGGHRGSGPVRPGRAALPDEATRRIHPDRPRPRAPRLGPLDGPRGHPGRRRHRQCRRDDRGRAGGLPPRPERRVADLRERLRTGVPGRRGRDRRAPIDDAPLRAARRIGGPARRARALALARLG